MYFPVVGAWRCVFSSADEFGYMLFSFWRAWVYVSFN